MTFRRCSITTWAAVLLGIVGCDNSNVVADHTLQNVGGTGPQQSTTGSAATGGVPMGGANSSATGGTSSSGGTNSTGGSYFTNGGLSTGGTGDLCLLPVGYGTCAADIIKYRFNASTGICEVFHYGGCGGNDNSFDTQQQCESRCSSKQTSATGGTSSSGGANSTGGPTGGTSSSGGTSSTGGSYSTNGGFSTGGTGDICLLPVGYGTCAADIIKYRFNAATGICEVFHYGGCGGNDNSFDTQQQCESRCSSKQTSATGGTSSVSTGGATGTGGSSGLPTCEDNGHGNGRARICGSWGTDVWWQYSGSAVVTSVGVSSDLPAACEAQRGLTLAIADGSSMQVGFSMNTAEPPALDALVGRHVEAVVSLDSNSGYRGDGELTLRDNRGLVLSVKWALGAIRSTSFDDVGIDANIGPGVCTNWCGAVVHDFQFIAGTSSVEISQGEQGTFQSGSSTYVAYAMTCSDKCGAGTVDGYPESSFGIFRNDL